MLKSAQKSGHHDHGELKPTNLSATANESSVDSQSSIRPNEFINYQGPLESGLNRRAFLKTATAVALLGGLPACKPQVPESEQASSKTESENATLKAQDFFTQAEKSSLDAVYMQLFPADGDGPSARDIRMLEYLEWAMTDPQNIDDGDPNFIRQGIGWLNDLASQTQGDKFHLLANEQQDKVLQQIARSNAGENWLSLLLYYLTEALLLDPVYGGNPEQIGWQWLEHQAGFPRPEKGKTYRDFD